MTPLPNGWRLASGRRIRVVVVTVGMFLLVPALAGWVTAGLGQLAGGALTHAVVDVVTLAVLVGLVPAQGATLGRLYTLRGPASDAAPDEPRRRRAVPPAPRWAAVLVPVTAAPLLIAGITLANPGGVPVLTSSTPAGDAIPADGFAISARGDAVFSGGSADILRCDSIACAHAATEPIEFAGGVYSSGGDVTAVAPDGTVIEVGDDRVTICPVAPPCTWNAAHLPDLGAAFRQVMIADRDGLVLAGVRPHSTDGGIGYDLVIVRCDDYACARATRLASVPLPADPRPGATGDPLANMFDAPAAAVGWGDLRTKLAVGVDGASRPVVAWTAGQPRDTVDVLRCDDPDCRTYTTTIRAFAVEGADGTPSPVVEALGIDRRGNPAIAVHTYAPTRQPGLHVQWGPTAKDRIFMVRCAAACRTQLWHEVGPDERYWFYQMAFRPDGSPGLKEGDGGSAARLVWCERNCA